MSRKIIIDGQIFQTPAWHRGMGKYSLELLSAVTKIKEAKQWTSIELIISKNLGMDKAAISEIKKSAPDIMLVGLELKPNDFRDKDLRDHNQKVIDNHVLESFTQVSEVDYLILSLMQGEIFPSFPTDYRVHKFLLFYDLVPLMFHETYLRVPFAKAEYLPKIAELLKADHYLTISKTVANDLSLYLGIDGSRIVNIDGGPINHSDTLKAVKVPKPFILMPTGNDPRKNNRRGVQGFNEFNKLQRDKYSLVITSFFKTNEIEELSSLANKVHFTGNVSGEELSYLYEQSAGLLFPSEYEGLGLPILEAVEKNKPVACSNISVFREMSETAFDYFEPKSILGIGRALNSLVSTPKINQKSYDNILKKYSWEKTAKKMTNAMLGTTPHQKPQTHPKLAIFGANPEDSGVSGNLMQHSHGELSRHYDVEYYLSKSQNRLKRVNYLPYINKTTKISEGFSLTPREGSQILYHLANDESCAEVLLCALAMPGIVVLHDLKLEKAWNALVDKNLISTQRYQLEEQIDKRYHLEGTAFITTLVQHQSKIIVYTKNHEQTLLKLLKVIKGKPHVYRASMPIGRLPYPEAMPDKVVDVGEVYLNVLANNNRIIPTKTDSQYNEALSRMKTVIFDGESSLYDITLALFLGVIPYIPEDQSPDCVGTAVQKYVSVDNARRAATALASSSEEYTSVKESMAQNTQLKSMQQLILELKKIIQGAT